MRAHLLLPRVVRLIGSFAAVVMLLLGTPARTLWACSCAVPAGVDLTAPITPQEAAAYGPATVVFTGTAVARVDTNPLGRFDARAGGLVQSSADPIIWAFVVDGVLHGSVASLQQVSSARDSASCGVSFAVGSRYQVVASSGAQGLQAGLCSRTMLLSTARPPETPAAGAAAGSAIGVAFGLLGIAGVTLIALLVLVRSRRPVHDVTGK